MTWPAAAGGTARQEDALASDAAGGDRGRGCDAVQPTTRVARGVSTQRRGAIDCAGVVLAGGLSSRMGRPKAWLPFGGVPLLVRVVERLRTAFEQVVVVGAEGQDLPETGAPVIRDRRPARGPLGGLEAALASASAAGVFAVSCDAPFLQPSLARRMAELARGFDAAVPRWEGRLNPLLAVYGAGVLPVVRRLLEADRLRPAFLFQEVRTRIVDEDEVREVDPGGLSFVNMNSPDDYAAALASAPPRVVFELFGQPCMVAGAREIAVDVPRPATIGSALQALARTAPALIGPVLEPGGSLNGGFLLSVEGREFSRDFERPVEDGERLLVLAASAGG